MSARESCVIKSTLLALLVLLFVGCSMPQPTYNTQTAEKAFDEEDTFIMYALLAEEQQQYLAAAGFYELLYHYAKKEEYKSRELASYSAARDYQALLTHSSAYANAEPLDIIAHRFEILVITSYSIHYTKLYELVGAGPRRRGVLFPSLPRARRGFPGKGGGLADGVR